jgi:DNA polymerase
MARYIKTVGPPSANIMLVGEAPGAEEDQRGLPFVGPAGKTLNILLAKAGIIREKCLIANVARKRPPKNDIGYYFQDKKQTIPKPELSVWLNELKRDIEIHKPNIVVALGATALWALTGIRGIKAARGFITESTLVPGQKVLPCYHPQAIGYSWNLSYTTVLDLKKALYHSAFRGLRRDNRVFDIDPTKDVFIKICEKIIKENKPLAVDIEATKALFI